METNYYYLAAKLISNGNDLFCCNVLRKLKISSTKFNYFFKPFNNNEEKVAWYGDPWEERNRVARSLALLFMHEMGK